MAWPNPAADQITTAFKASGSGDAVLWIHDVQGRSIMESRTHFHDGTNIIDLDLAALSPGVYFVSVDLHAERRTTRIVKLSEP